MPFVSPHAIREMQDSLNCCGFYTVKDRAWPFAGHGGQSCVEVYGRGEACMEGMEVALGRLSGVEMGIVLLAELLQVLFSYFIFICIYWAFFVCGNANTGA